MTRWKAAGLHLLLSALVGLSVFLVIFFVWYPPPLFVAMGGQELQLTVLAVDVVLGPLLTLAVYRAGKWGMRFDISVIVLLQLAALTYGVYVVAASRPVFIVVRPNIAYVVSAGEIQDRSLAIADPPYDALSWTGPVRVAVDDPKDLADKERRLDLVLTSGLDVHQLPEYYQPWDTVSGKLPHNAETAADLIRRKPEMAPRVLGWLEQHKRDSATVGLISLMTFHAEISLLIDMKSGAYLGLLDVDPS